MSESLFSSAWYRVAGLRPCLRSHAVIHRHLYRGQIWYVLQDRSSGRFHRFSPGANLVIGLMDGTRTLDVIWEEACSRLGDDAPTQDEVIGILGALHRADVLRTDAQPDMRELHERHAEQKRMKFRQYIANPLSLRLPLFDPDRLLNWLNPAGRVLFGPAGGLLWLAAALWALVVAGQNWPALTRDVSDHLFAAENLLLIALVFPFCKIVHEFGHAMAVKARGGEVHEMGVMLLVFMPVPYLDASSSLAFRDKRDRMLVGAAGMLSELALAALALLVWVNVEPGIVRALAYNVMLVAGVSTVIFNANPLLRFDGYYIFADYLEIPNLGQRANAHFAWIVKRYLLRLKNLAPGDDRPGERAWFVAFAVSSFCYRISVAVSIALMVATQYFVVGVLLAAWSLYNAIAVPIGKQLGYLAGSPELRGTRVRAAGTVAVLLAIVGTLVFLVPAPSWTRTEGVAVAAEDTVLRAAAEGFIVAVPATQRQRVRRGDVLIVTEDPEAGARLQALRAQVNEQRARLAAAFDQPLQRTIIGEQLASLQARLDDAGARAAQLVIRSPRDGIFLFAEAGDAPGRHVQRGEALGYVLDYSRITVQVVVPQGDIDLVRNMTRRVELRLVEDIPRLIEAQVRRVVPAATNALPGAALGAAGGGELALAPEQQSSQGQAPAARAANSVFVFELALAPGAQAPLRHIGSRIYVRFERESEPVGTQWLRALRRLLLSMFSV